MKMTVSQVTNQMIENHFEVKIDSMGIYGECAKGRRRFVTDLKKEFVKQYNKKISSKPSAEAKAAAAIRKEDNIQEGLIALERAFPELNVAIRETQPGVTDEARTFNVCFMYTAGLKHSVNIHSKDFSIDELTREFGHWKMRPDTQSGITLTSLSQNEMMEVANKMVSLHS